MRRRTAIAKIFRRMTCAIVLLVFTFFSGGSVSAEGLTKAQQQLMLSGLLNFDIAKNACGSTAQDTGSVTLRGTDLGEKIWNFFKDRQYTPEQIAGMMGNMQAESHFDPLIYQGDGQDHIPPLPGDSSGWGIVQWTPNSKVINHINKYGGTPPSGNVNDNAKEFADFYLPLELDFLHKQLEGTSDASQEKAAGDDLKQQTTVEGAAVSFLTKYERAKDSDPSGDNAKTRIGFANEIIKIYGGPASSTVATVSTTDACGNNTALMDVGSGTGGFTTNTGITYNGADQAVARGLAIVAGGAAYSQACGSSCKARCAHLAAAVWGYPSSGYDYAVGTNAGNGLWHALEASGHAHPGDRSPPIGALLFYSTGKKAGHVATYIGDNLIISNDVLDDESGKSGGVYKVSADKMESGPWNLSYLGWAAPIFSTSGGSIHYGP